MSASRYKTALLEYISSDHGSLSNVEIDLLTIASDIDMLTARLEVDSIFIADKFQKFALDLRSGAIEKSYFDPTGYPVLRSIAKDSARLHELKSSLMYLMRASLGYDILNKFMSKVDKFYR